VSLSVGDEVPHIFTRKIDLQPENHHWVILDFCNSICSQQQCVLVILRNGVPARTEVTPVEP
jgi:hypothetical protein